MTLRWKIALLILVIVAGIVLGTGFGRVSKNHPLGILKTVYSWWKPVAVELDYDRDGISDAAYIFSPETPYDPDKLRLNLKSKEKGSLGAKAMLLRQPKQEKWGAQIVNKGQDENGKDIYEISTISESGQICVIMTCDGINDAVFDEIYKSWGLRLGDNLVPVIPPPASQ